MSDKIPYDPIRPDLPDGTESQAPHLRIALQIIGALVTRLGGTVHLLARELDDINEVKFYEWRPEFFRIAPGDKPHVEIIAQTDHVEMRERNESAKATLQNLGFRNDLALENPDLMLQALLHKFNAP